DSNPPDMELHLAKNDGVLMKVVDARDGNQLNAMITVYDGSGQVAYDSGPLGRFGSPEPVRLALSPGSYRAVVSASGYATRTLTISSPSQQTVGLTPGGTLVVHTSSSSPLRARLIDSSGAIYQRPYSRSGEFTVGGEATTVPNVQPGTYKLQIIGDN